MATKQNLYIDQGTTFSQSFFIANPDGTPIDLTDYTGRSHLRREYDAPDFYEFSVNVGGNTGFITISLTPDYSSNIIAGRYYYDVELVSNSNNVTRLMEGICTINPEVTK